MKPKRGRPPTGMALTEHLHIRLSVERKRLWVESARRAGVPLSAWAVRWLDRAAITPAERPEPVGDV